ncbi:MAG: aspartyl/asparaginyl beta-hydroxylase domain-containing protein [Pseudomonadota bacterium]
MRMTIPIRTLFDHPIDDLLAALPPCSDPIWDVFRLRQQRFRVHDRTRSIVFRWSSLSSEGPRAIMTSTYPPTSLAAAADACALRLAEAYGGTVESLLLTELGPGQVIPPHRDGGPLLEGTHRCHLPVVTNPGVEFRIDDIAYHLRAGTVYEVDNLRRHAVANAGTAARIHLICNIRPGG